MDLQGGFPVPTEAGIAGEVAFQHRAGIDIEALGAAEGLQFSVEVPEAFLNEIVVILVPGIARDAVAAGAAFGKRTTARIVVQSQADDGFATWQHLARVAAALRSSLQPAHFAMLALRDPIPEERRVTGLLRLGDAAVIEAKLRSPRLDLSDAVAHRWPVKK